MLGGLAPEVGARERRRDPIERKRDWVEACTADGVVPGALVEVAGGDGRHRIAGSALFAPSDRYAPRAGTAPRAGRDALLLATAFVTETQREAGIGRLLVQAALREAIRLDRPAVEAYGDRRFRERACVLPATWLLHEGFTVHREHPRTPLLRLETRRTVRWAESLEHAWVEVMARLPVPAPVPERSGTVAPASLSTSRRLGGGTG